MNAHLKIVERKELQDNSYCKDIKVPTQVMIETTESSYRIETYSSFIPLEKANRQERKKIRMLLKNKRNIHCINIIDINEKHLITYIPPGSSIQNYIEKMISLLDEKSNFAEKINLYYGIKIDIENFGIQIEDQQKIKITIKKDSDTKELFMQYYYD